MDKEIENVVVRWTMQYVKNNAEQVRRQIDAAQDILGENYWGVYDFFCDVLEYEATYKILRARRCQVLFLIFLPAILLEEGNRIKIVGEFISDNSLVKHMDQIIKHSGVIIDDIVIHGRGLQEIYRLIDSDYQYPEVNIFVYAKSQKAALHDKLSEKLKFSVEVFEQEWRSLSTQFVNLIYTCASPYISYVESTYENDAVFQKNAADKNFLLLKNTNHYQELQKETSMVLFEKEAIPPILDSLGYDCCLRVYVSDVIGKTTYIPYVFLKNVKFSVIYSVIEEVCKNLSKEKAGNIIDDLLKIYSDDKQCHAISYKMKLFNTLMNHVYGLYLKEKYHILSENSSLDIAMLAVCYGEEIAMDFSRLEYQDVLSILKLAVPGEIEAEVKEDVELRGILDKISFSNSEYSITDEKMYIEEKRMKLQEYFYENNQIDEELAQQGEPRKRGLSLGAFYRVTDIKDIHLMSISQLNAWDSGIASCNIIYRNDDTVSSYIASGEQSFRYVLERHKQLLLNMIYAYNSPLWTETNETGNELAAKVYHQYLEDNSTKQIEKSRDGKILESFLMKNKDKLKDWGIPEIFA